MILGVRIEFLKLVEVTSSQKWRVSGSPEIFGAILGVGKLPLHKPALHTAYIGEDSSVLGTWNVWWTNDALEQVTPFELLATLGKYLLVKFEKRPKIVLGTTPKIQRPKETIGLIFGVLLEAGASRYIEATV